MEARGFRDLRFSNREIAGSPEQVADRILAVLDELGPSRSSERPHLRPASPATSCHKVFRPGTSVTDVSAHPSRMSPV
ncbi:hypothetical protein [Phenylobacterium sp.]|uniref:hypothetical protein n=1 Tax=Phenylobacterium sp. TaxID=1871053 RepID=UPI002E2F29CC|nr:hypothetical protein [Phenylobacterium sp.]HEX3364740.1 hypothetical protein [Phenylobacterium sp.]